MLNRGLQADPFAIRSSIQQTAAKSLETLSSFGVNVIPDQPGGTSPKTPVGLSELSNKDLGDAYDLFMQWWSFYNGLETYYRIELKKHTQWLQVVSAQIGRLPDVEKLPRNRVDETIKCHPDYQEALANLTYNENVHDGLIAETKRLSKCIQQISRQIAIRDAENGLFTRGSNINGSRRESFDDE